MVDRLWLGSQGAVLPWLLVSSVLVAFDSALLGFLAWLACSPRLELAGTCTILISWAMDGISIGLLLSVMVL